MKENSGFGKILRVVLSLVIACVFLFLFLPWLQGRRGESADASLPFDDMIQRAERDFREELSEKTMRHDYNPETNYYEYIGEFKVFIPDLWSNADPYFRPDKMTQMYYFEKSFVSDGGYFDKAQEIFDALPGEAGFSDADIRREYKYMLKGLYVNRFVFTAREAGETKLMVADLIRRRDGNGLTAIVYSENADDEYSSLQDYNEILRGMELRE